MIDGDRDLEFILTLDVDWVALSFVQRPEDMEEFRTLAGDKLKLMAKLEKPSAIEYLDEVTIILLLSHIQIHLIFVYFLYLQSHFFLLVTVVIKDRETI